MSDLVVQIWIALVLDFLIGDPRWLPHPVRLIGLVAQSLEGSIRKLLSSQRLAGIVVALIVIGGTGLSTWGILSLAGAASPLLKDLLSIGILYTTFAAKDLAVHSGAVLKELESGDVRAAREQVSRIVGRDTGQLDEPGIVRAAVESVAENTVDGVLAPLFFAFLFGPVGGMIYKAVNTLDSTFGYKNERYRYFGWASARIDDVANYLPARLSLIPISLAAALLGGRPLHALRVSLRDSRKHKSPNAGLPEAAFAGALGIQLGGPVYRNGQLDRMPAMGDPLLPLERTHIREANRLMFGVVLSAAFLLTAVRLIPWGGAR
ncbi:MAG: adenosylcobinamide-phosphate synthase CbiB [Syntrophaceae bacterium]